MEEAVADDAALPQAVLECLKDFGQEQTLAPTSLLLSAPNLV